jgi:hypothetical protein
MMTFLYVELEQLVTSFLNMILYKLYQVTRHIFKFARTFSKNKTVTSILVFIHSYFILKYI